MKIKLFIKDDAEFLLHVDSIPDKLSSAQYFLTLNLASGYWPPSHLLDTEKLTFVNNCGSFKWTVLLFRVKIGPSIFNKALKRILTTYKVDFVCYYFNDIIIFSSSLQEHMKCD